MADFDEIYNLYFRDVYRYLFALSGDPSIAEEITQETFFKALQKLDMYNYAHDFTAGEVLEPTSRINKMGRALCRAMEKATTVPVFYHMERNMQKSADVCPLCGREWSRTANEDISQKLCTFCRIAVD